MGGASDVLTDLVSFRNRRNCVVREQTWAASVHVELDVALRTKRRVRGHGDPKCLAQFHEVLLGQIRMKLDLKDSWLNASIAVQVNQQTALEIAAKNLRYNSNKLDDRVPHT